MIKQLHIFDFDGTLADSSHRYRLGENGRIDLAHWIANENLAYKDKPLPLLERFLEMQNEGHIFPLIATARIWCQQSRDWAIRHGINAHIIARKDRNDSRGGATLKIQGVNRLLNLKPFQNVKEIHVWEDNQDYLNEICDYYKAVSVPHFIPSNQGF